MQRVQAGQGLWLGLPLQRPSDGQVLQATELVGWGKRSEPQQKDGETNKFVELPVHRVGGFVLGFIAFTPTYGLLSPQRSSHALRLSKQD